MYGKVCVVTGANRGIGKQTALALACRGATVVMACRDIRRAALAAAGMRTDADGC
jgi:NAD(P)-dependent dehydrogenase (short-subunit alcohol dehydrogenase family)